jgi:hypothetical protein
MTLVAICGEISSLHMDCLFLLSDIDEMRVVKVVLATAEELDWVALIRRTSFAAASASAFHSLSSGLGYNTWAFWFVT